MDREFLENYSASEKEEIQKYANKLGSKRFGIDCRYPPEDRLKLNNPYARSVPVGNIWHQIPFYGTTVINLHSISESKEFKYQHGFDFKDIDKLIDLSKETGKVQFVLNSWPINYEGLDFLDPIFEELNPPFVGINRLTNVFEDLIHDELSIWKDEINNLWENPSFLTVMNKIGLNRDYFETVYLNLRIVGFHEMADEIANLTRFHPSNAVSLCMIANDVILQSYQDPLMAIQCLNESSLDLQFRFLEQIKFPHDYSHQLNKYKFTYEVGKFLTRKLTPIPKDYEGCIDLIYMYKQYDLNKVMNALNEAIQSRKIENIKEKKDEVSTILENVWSDANKLKRKIILTKHGISLGIGVIGAIATMPIGGVGGLLAGLGFEVIDKISDNKAYEPISEKLIKSSLPDHMVHIYDFQNKYKLL